MREFALGGGGYETLLNCTAGYMTVLKSIKLEVSVVV